MKLLILFLMAVSLNAFAEKNMLGERTPANSEDPCAHEIGCGPCYKSCKSAVSAEGVKTINTTSKKSSKKSTVVGE
jgi:hypothetical protein